MADGVGMADIRGLDIQKLVVGFAEEENIFKKYCRTTSTAAREIRWYQKTAGWVVPATTTGITSNLLANTAERSLPPVAGPSWTRNTSYVMKYFVESELISEEDIKDSDIDVLAVTIHDLVRTVQRQVDARIVYVMTENYTPATIQTDSATATWNTTATCNPILDMLKAEEAIRSYSYDPKGAVAAMNPEVYKDLMNYLITVKGSSIPSFAADALRSGEVMNLLNFKIVVSENVTDAYVIIFLPNKSVAWKEFVSITSATITEPGIGRKFRVWEEGQAMLENPKSVFLLTGC